jgi:Fe2+ or Zn2+ uptake regulation protein
MSIIRAPRPQEKFYILDKKISEDKRLSWPARGLLVFLLGKPDNWKVNVQALISETGASDMPLGRDGVYRILKALKAAGYVKTVKYHDGKIDYFVSEVPDTEKPDLEKPDTDNPHVLVKTDKAVRTDKAVKNDSGKFASEPARGYENSGKPSSKAKRKTPAKSMDHSEAIAILESKGVEKPMARHWIEQREFNRGIVVPSVIARHEEEAEAADISLHDALDFAVEHNLFDFSADRYFEYAT